MNSDEFWLKKGRRYQEMSFLHLQKNSFSVFLSLIYFILGNDPLLQRKDFSKRIRRLKRKCNLLFCAKDIVGFSKMRHCITSLLHQIFLKRLFNFNTEKCTHFWAKYWSLADSNHKVWTVLIIVRTDSFKFPCLNCPFLHSCKWHFLQQGVSAPPDTWVMSRSEMCK